MSIKSEIKSAIASHSMWKTRLKKCIETGIFDAPVDVVAVDHECYFGKWLYGETMTPTIRNSEEYKRVRDCHAKFHLAAAKVVELSLSGKKAEAEAMMSGEYAKVTTELVMEMASWADNAP